MAIIEGMDDDVTILLSLLIVVITIVLAWISTNVREPLLEIFIIDGSRIGNLIQRLQDRNSGAQQQAQPAGSDGDRAANAAPNGSHEEPSSEVANTAPEAETRATNDTEQELPLAGSNQQNVDNAADASGMSGEAGRDDAAATNSQEAADVNQSTDQVTQNTSEQDSVLPATQSDNSVQEPESSPPSQNEIRQRRVNFFSGKSNDEVMTSQTSPELHSAPAADSTQDNNTATRNISPQTDSDEQASRPGEPEGIDGIRNVLQEDIPDGHIRVRLKYLDDRQRLVHANPEDTIGQFKSRHFAAEIAENLMVRFIYNGQELRHEATLQSYNVVDNSVIHCLLSAQSQNAQRQEGQDQGDLDIGRWMLPLFGLILGLVWYCRVTYRNYFNSMSTLSLIGITFFYLMAVLATARRDEQAHH